MTDDEQPPGEAFDGGDPAEDKTAPGRVPQPPPAEDIRVLEKLTESVQTIGAHMREAMDQLHGVGLTPAQRVMLAAELREAGNNLRAAATILEGRGPWMPV